jgi:hypothetical protein
MGSHGVLLKSWIASVRNAIAILASFVNSSCGKNGMLLHRMALVTIWSRAENMPDSVKTKRSDTQFT